MIFIDFGLLRAAKYLNYLLKSTEVIQIWEFDNLHTYDSVCKDNSWIHGKCRQRFLSNVFFYFLHVFNVFFNFHFNVYYIYALNDR